MTTASQRARELATIELDNFGTPTTWIVRVSNRSYRYMSEEAAIVEREWWVEWITAALLEERRAVWEEAAKLAENNFSYAATDGEKLALHQCLRIAEKCRAQAKEGCRHEWGIDGMHSNEFCKKCFVSKP